MSDSNGFSKEERLYYFQKKWDSRKTPTKEFVRMVRNGDFVPFPNPHVGRSIREQTREFFECAGEQAAVDLAFFFAHQTDDPSYNATRREKLFFHAVRKHFDEMRREASP